MWAKLLDNLLLPKYLISVAATLKPDWFVETRWFVMKKQTSCFIKDVQIFSDISKEVRSADSLLEIVCYFLWTGTTLAFFHSSRKIPLYKHDLKIIPRGLHIDGPHIFNIWILILSWPCAFSESKFWIILRISSLEKVTLHKNLSILSKSPDDRLLPLLITVHYLAKNELNNSAFFLKSVANLFS